MKNTERKFRRYECNLSQHLLYKALDLLIICIFLYMNYFLESNISEHSSPV